VKSLPRIGSLDGVQSRASGLAAALLLTAAVARGQEAAAIQPVAGVQAAEFEFVPVRPAPAPLDGARRAEIKKALSHSVQRVVCNVVQLSIERRVGDGMSVAVEASGLVVDRAGHVVTIGSSLEQAGRVAVHFQEAAQLRPRRARVIGIDASTDVGVLEIGPIELPALEFAQPEPAAAEGRYVVTLFGQPREPRATDASEDGSLVLGFLQEPVRNPTVGGRRFDQLLRVSLVRSPDSAGGVIAGQDGRIAGLLLQPSRELAAGTALRQAPLLALPAMTMQQGLSSVLAGAANPAATPLADSGAAAMVARGRAWLGFGAHDLVEDEFLHQLGRPGAIVVTDVFEGSPALAAALEPHDVVVGWNGEPLGSVDELTARVAAAAPGTTVELECVRRLERRTVAVTLGEW